MSYHSLHGAIQESSHVFIAAGIRPWLETATPTIRVAELGFGTGLNAYLLAIESENHPTISFEYLGLERYPLAVEIAQQLNYPSLLDRPSDTLLLELHQRSWEETHPLRPNFSFRKVAADFLAAELPKNWAHCLFFDAFAPSSQPELWEPDALRKAADTLAVGGHLVTYCAKGVVKRSLAALGLSVTPLPGPPGKREMTRATKI